MSHPPRSLLRTPSRTPFSSPSHETDPLPLVVNNEELELLTAEIKFFGWSAGEIALLQEKSNHRDDLYLLLLLQAMDKNEPRVFEKYLSNISNNLPLLGEEIIKSLTANPKNRAHQQMLFILRPVDLNRLGYIFTDRLQAGDSSFIEKFEEAYSKLWSSMQVTFAKPPMGNHKA